MIKFLRKSADWLERLKCNIHSWWNRSLDKLKTTCVCEKSGK